MTLVQNSKVLGVEFPFRLKSKVFCSLPAPGKSKINFYLHLEMLKCLKISRDEKLMFNDFNEIWQFEPTKEDPLNRSLFFRSKYIYILMF